MCGIFGFVGSRSRAESVDLDAALKSLHHRGPDDRGTYFGVSKTNPDIACAFAHTRLSIIDLSAAGHQPMTTDDSRYTIVYNGEVYNFRDVRTQLEQLGHRFHSSGDTEVVLKCYAQWGRDCVSRLRGMFAFAIWDAERGSLFMARDRLGIKPLYYTTTANGGIAFASEIRPLMQTGLAARRLSRASLAQYLSFGSVSDPSTIIEGIYSLEPAHTAFFQSYQMTLQRYWSLPAESESSRDWKHEIAAIEPLLQSSVNSELVADVPVGIFLSGGIDSSVVTALAARSSSRPVHTFTVTFDEESYNEGKYAAAVATRYGTDHHQVHLRGPAVAERMHKVVDALDQPSADGVNTFFVSEAARQSGLAVVLSGVGGDEVFAGYPAFQYFPSLLRFGRAFRRIRSSYVSNRSSFNGLSNRASKIAALAETGGSPLKTYSVVRNMFTKQQIEQLLAPIGTPPDDASIATIDVPENGNDAVNLYSRMELSHYVPNTLLRDTDAMSMAHSLEVRVPLLDHELVEKVIAIPARYKLGRRKKALLSDTVADLPETVRNRPKTGFVLPLDAWFRGPLKPSMSDLLVGDIGSRSFLDQKSLRSAWSAFLRASKYVSYSRIWCLAALIAWCDRNRVELAG